MLPDEGLDIAAVRRALNQFLGEERYCRFVREIVTTFTRRHRLRYWQETALLSFLAEHPEFDHPRAKLLQAFFECWVHRCNTSQQKRWFPAAGVDIVYGREFERARAAEFPLSYGDFGDCEEFPTVQREVWCCPECDEARSRWELP